MITIQQISKDRTNARGVDALKYSLLTTLLGDLELEAKRTGNPDMDATPIIQKFIKNAEMILGICPTNMKASEERAFLRSYLPKHLDKMELEVIIALNEFKNLKEFMDYLKANYTNQYDGRLASDTWKEMVTANA